MENKVSIIVLTYDQENFIAQTLDGIFMQKVNFPIELIVCNDASKDGTDKIIRDYIAKCPPHIDFKYFTHERNVGATPNFYFALKQVTGDYVAFCEGDDYWTEPTKLQRQFDFLTKNPEYSLVFHNAYNISDDPKIHLTPFSNVENRDYSTREIYKHWVIHTATVMMRSEVLKSKAKLATIYDDTLQYFDTVLFIAASTVGKIRGMKRLMSAYRRHDAGLSAGKSNYKRDLKHNHLDQIIGNYYKGEISKLADWKIFVRSEMNFKALFRKGKLSLAIKFLPWLLRNRLFLMKILEK